MSDRKEFRLFLPIDLHAEIRQKAFDAGVSMNKYILDCIQLVGLQNGMAEKMDKEYMKHRPIPTSYYGKEPKTPTESSFSNLPGFNPMPKSKSLNKKR